MPQPGYRTVFALAFVIAFLVHLLLFCLSPMVEILMTEMQLSHAQFGFVFSVAMISLILFRLPWGLVADRRGYVGVLRIALVLSAGAAGLRAVSDGYTGLLVSQFILGLGLAAAMPCLGLMVRAWAQARPGLGTGIYFAGFAVGNATALAATPVLLTLMSWREVFLLYAGVAGVVCLLWFLLGRSRPVANSAVHLGDIRLVMRERLVWVLLFLLVGSMGCYDTLASWMPRVLQMKGLEPEYASLLPAGFLVAGPLTGLMLDRFPSRRMLVVLLGVAAAAGTALMISTSLPLLLVCLFVVGFATTGVSVTSLTMPVERPQLSPYAGTVVGFVTSASNVGPLVVPVVFGYLIDVTGTYPASLAFVAVLGLVLFLGCAKLMK
ncbi:MAG: MFS transporter [Dehalococcoidia bacterium]|nr:MFS transporter [Dehalococcoidia bacterium]